MSFFADVGRTYQDDPKANPRIDLRSFPNTSWTDCGAIFDVSYSGRELSQPVWYAHLALLKLLKHYEFRSVLDLGSNDGMVAAIFDFLGKETVALEPAVPHQNSPDYPVRLPDLSADFLDVHFAGKFDAIWCSHVLEHVRNPGQFLDKIHDDLREGGILAITVPFNDFGLSLSSLVVGHHGKYNHWLLIYQLICAGFDCRDAAVAVYNGQVSVIVRKVSNNVRRGSTALYCPFPPEASSGAMDDLLTERRLYSFFPVVFSGVILDDGNMRVSWDLPV